MTIIHRIIDDLHRERRDHLHILAMLERREMTTRTNNKDSTEESIALNRQIIGSLDEAITYLRTCDLPLSDGSRIER